MTNGIICPKCKSKDIVKRGYIETKLNGKKQRYFCKSCNKKFIPQNPFFRMRNTPEKITCALDLFFRGLSTREVQEHFKAFFPHNSYHSTWEGMKKSVEEMYRVLREKGMFFITLQPRENQEWRFGKEIEPWTFVASDGPDKGVIHHFVDRDEIEKLFGTENLIKVYRDKRGDWCVLGKLKKEL